MVNLQVEWQTFTQQIIDNELIIHKGKTLLTLAFQIWGLAGFPFFKSL